jgi:ATP-dependent DNA ligase
MVQRTPEGVRIKTRRGFDWTDRFPLIIEAQSGCAPRPSCSTARA